MTMELCRDFKSLREITVSCFLNFIVTDPSCETERKTKGKGIVK